MGPNLSLCTVRLLGSFGLKGKSFHATSPSNSSYFRACRAGRLEGSEIWGGPQDLTSPVTIFIRVPFLGLLTFYGNLECKKNAKRVPLGYLKPCEGVMDANLARSFASLGFRA